MMSRRYWLINLLLGFIVVLLSIRVYDVWTRTSTRGVEAAASKPKLVTSLPSMSVGAKKEPAPAKGFQSVSEKNLFSPERKEFPILASPGGGKGTGRPTLVLYGVTLGEDYQSALITNPGRRPERGERETMSVKVGDKVGEYQVAKISADRIMLENEIDSFEVLLYDPSQPKKRPALPPPTTARPTPTPRTPTPSPGTPPRPVTPSPGVRQPSLPPAPASPGISQSPLSPPAGRQPASRNLLRQRRTPVAPPVAPRTPVTTEFEEEEEEEEEDDEE